MNKTIENHYFESEKRYEDLTITDNFMFAKVMLNEQLCKKFLEMILHIRIRRIEYYNDEKTLKKFYHSKGIRLDVYLKEEWRVEYMTMMELEREKYREGLELGMKQAREKYREGREEGREEGIEQGIRYSVKQALKYGADMEDVIRDIMLEYNMTEERVKEILNKE